MEIPNRNDRAVTRPIYGSKQVVELTLISANSELSNDVEQAMSHVDLIGND
jgi:hypothetical protein